MTLALSGGLGEISGDRRTHVGHTYSLPGSMAPQGALCPKLARFMGGHPLQAGKDGALNKRARDQPVLNGGLVGISGARRMPIDHTYPLPESMAPKGALRPQHARFPNAHPNGRPLVKRASLGHKSSLGSHASRQWVGVPHTRPPIPRYPPMTPAESPGRRLARQKSLSPCQKSRKDPISTVFPLRNDQPYSEPGSDLVRFGINWAVRGLAEQPRHTPCTGYPCLPSIGTKV